MQKKKKTAIRTGALAWRINLSEFFALFLIFLAINIFLIVYDFQTGVFQPLEGTFFQNVINSIKIIYFTPKYSILLRGEGLVLLFKLVFGSISIRRTLKPIDELTSVAIQLGSESSELDEEKFLRLEAAIDEISPTAENAKLRTGDQQLAGLELAVNNLIERMRDSYRQQARLDRKSVV